MDDVDSFSAFILTVSEKSFGIINFKPKGMKLTAENVIFIFPKNHFT
jgi:hypothetical protein